METNTLGHLIECEQNLMRERDENFNKRVQLLYKLDECTNLSKDEREKLSDEIEHSRTHEAELDVEIEQVRVSMKHYIINLLKL